MMAFKIGFTAEKVDNYPSEAAKASQITSQSKKSVVRIYFADRNTTLTYYNDRFDLHMGDKVYVDGKLEGLRGIVVDVSYNFKIKASDYKRVIAVADTEVKGRLFMSGSHFLTFEPYVLPQDKIITWFKPPANPDDEFVSGSDGSSFLLDDLSGMKISKEIAERGYDYYTENRVRYISLAPGTDGCSGFAIVEGTEPYEVGFKYSNGEITDLVCSCFCSYNCKHEYAVMIQLREIFDIIENNYAQEYEKSGYFAAVDKSVLFSYVIAAKEKGSIVL